MLQASKMYKAEDETESRSPRWLGKQSDQALQKTKITKAAFYAVQVFYSFFIMYVVYYMVWLFPDQCVGYFL